MEFPNSILNLSKIEDSTPTTRNHSICLSERSQSHFKSPIKRCSSEGNLNSRTSYDVAAETMRRNSLEEVSENMQHQLDVDAENILETGEVSNENSLKKKTFLMNMFRTAVFKVIKDTSGEEYEGPLPDDPTTNLTLLPTQKTKAIYLSQVFKYAVKQTIIERRQDKSSGDPWDEFFYRIYSAEKPQVHTAKRCQSAGIKLNLNRDLQDKMNLTSYDGSVKEKLTPYRSSARGASEKGKRALDNLSRISTNISKKRQQEINQEGGDEQPAQHATLPKLPPPRKTREGTDGQQFRVGRVRHSPDGRSPLSRLFYLPHIPKLN